MMMAYCTRRDGASHDSRAKRQKENERYKAGTVQLLRFILQPENTLLVVAIKVFQQRKKYQCAL